MSTFFRAGPGMRELEALVLAAIFTLCPQLVASHTGSELVPHAGWIGVLLLAARYGVGGFLVGLAFSAAAMAAALAMGGTGLAAGWQLLQAAPNLAALGACLVVSWIVSRHLRRQCELQERATAASGRALSCEATIRTLLDLVAALRARIDRASASLSFLRDAAGRLHGSDPVSAAEAAVSLALSRTGATVAAVMIGTGSSRRYLAFRDARGFTPHPGLEPGAADLTASIQSGGDPVGAISLWGLPDAENRDAARHDLHVIAEWCAPVLTMAGRREGPKTSLRVVQ